MSFNGRLGVVPILPLNVKQAERTVAAYLGFDSIIDLQRFLIMWPCLEAMQLLSALPSFMFQSTTEGSRVRRSNHQVGPASDYIQLCWMACVLVILRYSVTVYATNTLEQNRARTIVAIRSLPPRFWIPDHILEEDDVPPYPLLRPNLRRERYLDARAHLSDEEFEVTEDDVPWWMRHYL
ncbi:hypothetical protein N7517_009190 [Penicillium concentricum]|uniref:Uncharacterized protein n=1 Tax=Penicillium concentricum TaxID=293559 RepID=A0A9W9RIN3_9EURO|nr:uncharacterized protein N7517_009190 [Penicillium concentricum]KAJ5359999.1 hypothetical protein N7517_009190 [Penicillium concentricum]